MVVEKIDANKPNHREVEAIVERLMGHRTEAVVVTGNDMMATFVSEGDEIRDMDNGVLVVMEEEDGAHFFGVGKSCEKE